MIPYGRPVSDVIQRPDITCPTWNISVYDEKALAPGYFFVAIYGHERTVDLAVGPQIYDSNGGLIWSGSPLFNGTNVYDFKVVDVFGEHLLSVSHGWTGSGYILDNQYRVKQTVIEGIPQQTYNMHDFHTVDSGMQFLYSWV